MNHRLARFLFISGGALAAYGIAAWWFLLPPIKPPASTAIETVSAAQCADPEFSRLLAAQHTNLFVPLAQIPESVVDALLEREDAFYHHHGVDWVQMARAGMRNLRQGKIEVGASTLTMQLMRELFLDKQRKFLRKAREIAYALQAERRLTKAEILELYLNFIHWGPGIHGIGTAACYYFGVLPSELDAEQAARLVRVLPNPDVRGGVLRAMRGDLPQ